MAAANGIMLAMSNRDDVLMKPRETDMGSDCRCKAAGAITRAIAIATSSSATRWRTRSVGDKSSLNEVLKTAIS